MSKKIKTKYIFCPICQDKVPMKSKKKHNIDHLLRSVTGADKNIVGGQKFGKPTLHG